MIIIGSFALALAFCLPFLALTLLFTRLTFRQRAIVFGVIAVGEIMSIGVFVLAIDPSFLQQTDATCLLTLKLGIVLIVTMGFYWRMREARQHFRRMANSRNTDPALVAMHRGLSMFGEEPRTSGERNRSEE